MGPTADPSARVMDLHDIDDENEEIEMKRAEIAETRAEMSGTIDAIKDRLEPKTLMAEAKEHVKETVDHAAQRFSDATVGRAQDALGAAGERVSETVSAVTHTAQEYGSSAAHFVQRNAVPLALIGIGLGWLYASSQRRNGYGPDYYGVYDRERFTDYPSAPGYPAPRRAGEEWRSEGREGMTSQVREKAHEVRERAGEAMHQAQEKAGQVIDRVQDRAGEVAERARERTGEVVHRVQDTAGQAADSFGRMLQENPLAVGAVAVGIGAAIGLLLPETRQENRWMGGARDRLVERAQDTAQDVMHKAQAVAESTVQTVKEEARHAAREVTQTAKEEARNQGLMPESGTI